MSVKGPLGLDDPDRMLGDLAAATGLTWRTQPVGEGNVLSGGIVEILLVAVVTKVADKSVDAAVDAVREVVGRWRRERLDPPETSVTADPLPEADGGAADGGADPGAAEGLDG